MKSIIIGTAGHIDHGKTALVKAMTGIDADRLEEEKRRGITIDLGFAHLELPIPGGEAGAPDARGFRAAGWDADHAPSRPASGAEQTQKREQIISGLERSDR